MKRLRGRLVISGYVQTRRQAATPANTMKNAMRHYEGGRKGMKCDFTIFEVSSDY